MLIKSNHIINSLGRQIDSTNIKTDNSKPQEAQNTIENKIIIKSL